MPHVVRTSLSIGGKRIQDYQFTRIFIHQTIGWHHDFEIRFRQDATKGVLDEKANDWIGKTCNIGIDLIEEKQLELSPIKDCFIGIVTNVSLSRTRETAELVVKGQSPTIAADDGFNTRSFTNKSLEEIAVDVLRDYEDKFPEKPIIEPKVSTASTEYTVQYKESNFEFLARLANRYGEWMYYDGLKFYVGKPKEEDPIKLNFGEKSLIDFDLSVKAVPFNFEMKGYDYTKHESLQEQAPQAAASNTIGKKIMDISKSQLFSNATSIPINMYLNKDELKTIVKRMEQILIDEMVVMNGTSRNPSLKLGAQIEVKDKQLGENYGTFVITSLTHDIAQGGDYFNQFEAVPVEVATPPLSTKIEPPFCETQLAKVTDIEDEDSLGRIKVQFIWQEGTEEKTPWLRVASPYTGKDKGFYIIPEKDDQVVVAFEDNHPEKPFVLTSMYNAEAKPEYYETNNYYFGFKTKSGDEWKFEGDKNTFSVNTKNKISLTATNNIVLTVGDSSINIEKENIKITSKNIELDGETIYIGSSRTNTIELISGGVIELGNDSSASSTINIWGTTTNIEGDNLTVEGTASAVVEAPEITIEGSSSVTVEGATVHIDASGNAIIEGSNVKLNP